jgi:8-oxo-dGTP pyrophosphatase MutT (NUDIX family)
MLISSKEELDLLLSKCRSKQYSDIKNGGNFYKVRAQEFLFPDGTIQLREYLDKKKSSIVVPITSDGNLVFVVQPIALSEEGSLIEFPAGYWELEENGLCAGIRELSVETGYTPFEILSLGSHYQDPGSIRQKVDSLLALGCVKTQEQKLDKGEYIKAIEIPYELAIALMAEGYLKDANSYIELSKTERVLQKRLISNQNIAVKK